MDLSMEIIEALDADPEFAKAFATLTPRRPRSHVIHVGRAKQEMRRQDRIAHARDRSWPESVQQSASAA